MKPAVKAGLFLPLFWPGRAGLFPEERPESDSTSLFGGDCQNIAALAHTRIVSHKHTKAVGRSWTQVHHSELSEFGVGEISYC